MPWQYLSPTMHTFLNNRSNQMILYKIEISHKLISISIFTMFYHNISVSFKTSRCPKLTQGLHLKENVEMKITYEWFKYTKNTLKIH